MTLSPIPTCIVEARVVSKELKVSPHSGNKYLRVHWVTEKGEDIYDVLMYEPYVSPRWEEYKRAIRGGKARLCLKRTTLPYPYVKYVLRPETFRDRYRKKCVKALRYLASSLEKRGT